MPREELEELCRMERTEKRRWEGVKFANFPLILEREFPNLNRRVWQFGGRYFTLTNWGGVEYQGRFRFYTLNLDPEEILARIWDLKEVEERGPIINAKGERIEVVRCYYSLLPSSHETPKYWARFIGGHFKYTLRGIGRNRDYQEIAPPGAEVVCTTSNRCRSGRYGAYASLVLFPEPWEPEEEGVY